MKRLRHLRLKYRKRTYAMNQGSVSRGDSSMQLAMRVDHRRVGTSIIATSVQKPGAVQEELEYTK